ncbi:ArsR/SmtB family transcription factor [Streptomyces sp. NPDC005931]|uniref:ArsR/SmtB family transcription factor n=1 Tax=Streptomyces sp. NPDC005931 TaxID=3364737 RepID=UPI00369A5524
MPRTPVDRTRLHILHWLAEPGPAATGVTADAVAARFGLSLPVALAHLRLLTALGVVSTDRRAGQVYHRRDDRRIAEVAELFEKGW